MPLNDLSWDNWLSKLEMLVGEDGYIEPLGRRHAAVLLEKKPTLLVTFETHQSIAERSHQAHPLGWQMVEALGWSHLCLVSDGDTWFRSPWIYRYFDRLDDDGFFDEFRQVIFYGAGPCGYAAAAYSVAAPGARVLVIQPQATLDTDRAGWDKRFPKMRRTDFTSRYGFAPDMLDAADTAILLYDPAIRLDAMHATLFARPNVIRYPMRFAGPDMQTALMRMDILLRMLAELGAGTLSRHALARLFRARRTDYRYLNNLLVHLTGRNRYHLSVILCRRMLEQRESPSVRALMKRAERRLQGKR